jgi:hypothetical protein
VLPLLAVCAAAWGRPAAPAATVLAAGVQANEKESRTPAQRKIASQVLDEIYRRQGKAAGKHIPGKTIVKIDTRGRALIDVRAEVTPALLTQLASFESEIVSTSVEYHSIVAWVPLLKIETLAADSAVRAIAAAPQAITR